MEDYDSLLLLRSPADDSLSPTDIADLARGQRSDDGTLTLVAGSESVTADAFWPRLSQLLDTLGDSGTETVRLALAGAGLDGADRPATARRIADAWGLTVEAPDGPPLLVPGGTLFVPGVPVGSATDGGWWRFAPQTRPRPLGPRTPAPSWQDALRGIPAGTDSGCVVEQIPAGLLIRPAEAAPTRPGDLYHSVPVSPARLAVVVGVHHGEDVLADDVGDILAALPEPVRSAVRLAPGGRRDLLPLAQSVADRLDAEVELMTGLPLIAAGRPLGTYSVQSVLVGADRTPRWLPFVDAVMCRPARGAAQAPPPRLLRWTAPVPGAAQPADGVVALSDRWQVTVTRAGLWVGPLDGPRLSHTDRPVSPSGPLIEVGLPGERLDLSLWPVLSSLLGALLPALRASVTLHVHGSPQDGGRELRRLAAHHGLRTIRFASFTPSAPLRRELTGPPETAARPHTTSGPGRAEHPAPTSPASKPSPSARPAQAGAAQGAEEQPPAAEPTAAAAPALPRPAPPKAVGPGSAERPGPSNTPREHEASEGTSRTGPVAVAATPDSSRTAQGATSPRTPDEGEDSAAPGQAPPPAKASARTAPESVSAAPRGLVTTGSTPGGPLAETQERAADQAPLRQEAGSDPAAETPRAPDAPQPPSSSLPPVPFGPGHRSTEDERHVFRALADAEWDRHGTAVTRALARMPALRGKEQEAARADLIALRLYLHNTEGPLSHQALARAVRAHDSGLLPYVACLTSALNRLPSYRGVVLRATGGTADRTVPRPGALLRDAAPVSATPLDPARPSMTTGASYVIWSVGARRVRQLLDPGDGPEEVVFTPGSLFRVLDVRRSGQDQAHQIFLRELPGSHAPVRSDPEGDLAALARLDEAVRGRSAPARAEQWPERCSGPFGTAQPETTANH
ncbi:hypothetical protein DI272_02035 [Streptomyces sp. Act143]|uniref:hypothetical protein n=1 Tax=Streptomyces sp. Act143 TaxID=2200760 RepID=UPI000D67C54E|nr:hypothetical protein [Streptomyces sp. Act143]PWI13048.1 hypothetical protein DI272_02035 [Streptomyces sp. Act143]